MLHTNRNLVLALLTVLATGVFSASCADDGSVRPWDTADARVEDTHADTLATSDTAVPDSGGTDLGADTNVVADTAPDATRDATDADGVDAGDATLDDSAGTDVDEVLDGVLDASDSTDTAAVACDRQGFAVAAQTASGEAGFVDFVAANVTSTPYDAVNIELLYSVAPATPYHFDFTGENYRTCETCVTIRTAQGCSGTGCAPTKLFLAYAGQLDVTQWDVPGTGARFAGTLRNIEAHEVTLAGGMDFTSTPVPGGEVWCIDELAFDSALEAWTP